MLPTNIYLPNIIHIFFSVINISCGIIMSETDIGYVTPILDSLLSGLYLLIYVCLPNKVCTCNIICYIALTCICIHKTIKIDTRTIAY